jgi:outer membrane protein TolC
VSYPRARRPDRQDSDSSISELDREFRSGWVTEVTVPLMRGFRMNEARLRVMRSEAGREISDFALRAQLSELLAGVETLYWDLAAARAGVNVARKSLQSAQDLLERARAEENLGSASSAAVSEAEAGVAEREFSAIQAESLAAAAKDALLSAILAPSAQAFEERELIPEAPLFTEYAIDTKTAIDRALASRPEMSEARRRVEAAKVEEQFAQNQARPRLDLTASYSVAGLRGRSKALRETFQGQQLAALSLSDPNVQTLLDGPANRDADGQGNDTIEDFFRARGSRSYALGAKFEVPFGNNAGQSLRRQRGIEVRRAQTVLRRMEQKVILEVRDAVRGVQNAAKAVRAAERRQAAVQRRLRAEQGRLRLGDSTPFQTLQFEEELAEAERQLIDALRRHRNAITRVEQVQGTLLSARGVSLDDE